MQIKAGGDLLHTGRHRLIRKILSAESMLTQATRDFERNLDNMEKLLLHVCCAPCSTSVIEALKEKYDLTLFFYNPNIEPEEEYLLRLKNAQNIAEDMNLSLISADYNNKEWKDAVKGYENEKEGGKRCEICFKHRLEVSAKTAKEKGFNLFTTTLTVSPYKDAVLINKIGEETAKEHNLSFLSADFKKENGYRKSIELSKKHNLYRQHYCGCLFSKIE